MYSHELGLIPYIPIMIPTIAKMNKKTVFPTTTPRSASENAGGTNDAGGFPVLGGLVADLVTTGMVELTNIVEFICGGGLGRMVEVASGQTVITVAATIKQRTNRLTMNENCWSRAGNCRCFSDGGCRKLKCGLSYRRPHVDRRSCRNKTERGDISTEICSTLWCLSSVNRVGFLRRFTSLPLETTWKGIPSQLRNHMFLYQ
jgi:hypothetical protein